MIQSFAGKNSQAQEAWIYGSSTSLTDELGIAISQCGLNAVPLLDKDHFIRKASMEGGRCAVVIFPTDSELNSSEFVLFLRYLLDKNSPVLLLIPREGCSEVKDILIDGGNEFFFSDAGVQEIKLRINLILARSRSVEEDILKVGPYVVDGKERKIILEGESLNLTPAEWLIAFTLFRNFGATVPRSEILAEILGRARAKSSEKSRSLDVLVCRLRRSLKLHRTNFEIMANYGFGYRLTGAPSGAFC